MGNFISGSMDIIIIVVSLLITSLASMFVNSSYNKYKQIKNNKELTGFDVARKILDHNGLDNILVLETQGNLTDHYDPQNKCVKLSTDIYHGKSIASMAVAAHECGHAIQDKEGYSMLRLRHSLIPLVNISNKAGYVAILLSFILGLTKLFYIGIAAELIILFFQLVTLPVEFNASNRALKQLEKLSICNKKDKSGAKSMLTAAALTYVASVLDGILQVLRLILMSRRRD